MTDRTAFDLRLGDLPPGDSPPGRFIGRSEAMKVVYRILENAAPTNATVFITGESGVGKELCAEAVHALSRRSKKPFVAVNCAAIPKDLMESEIFGHVKGAFTGAISDRKGAALQADGGTLFLDEIAEMDLSLQTKLLRFLQDRTVKRIGEDTPRRADVRIVCATNRDPQVEVAAGRFREDLFYRLHVVPIELPPLRHRDDDIALLARHFLEVYSREDEKGFKSFSSDAMSALLNFGWPGNVRQLENVIRSAVILNRGEIVTLDMLPRPNFGSAPRPLASEQPFGSAGPIDPAPASADSLHTDQAPPDPVPTPTEAKTPPAEPRSHSPEVEPGSAEEARPGGDAAPAFTKRSIAAIRPLEDVIRSTIEEAIAACDGSILRAAEALKVAPSTLYRRVKTWHVEPAGAAESDASTSIDGWASAEDVTVFAVRLPERRSTH